MYTSLDIPPAHILQDLGAVREYDYNLWTDDDLVLRLTAYELLYSEDGKNIVGTNNDQFVTLTIPMNKKNTALVTHLLGEGWRDEDHAGFDEWVGLDQLTAGVPPKELTEFLDGLTAYVPDVEHDWTSYLDGTETDLSAPRKCKACGIEYVVARWK